MVDTLTPVRQAYRPPVGPDLAADRRLPGRHHRRGALLAGLAVAVFSAASAAPLVLRVGY